MPPNDTSPKGIASSAQRRRGVRRSLRQSDGRVGLWAMLYRPAVAWAMFFGLVLAALAWVIIGYGHDGPRYSLHQVLLSPLVARTDFIAIDELKTLQGIENAKDRTPSVYRPNDPYLAELRRRLEAYGRIAADPTIQSMQDLAAGEVEQLHLNDQALAELKRYAADTVATQWSDQVDAFLSQLAGIPALPPMHAAIERDPLQTAAFYVELIHPQEDRTKRSVAAVIGVPDDLPVLRNRVNELLVRFPARVRESLLATVMTEPQPIYLYDREATEQARAAAATSVRPVEVIFNANTVVLPAGTALTEVDLKLIERESQAYLEALGPTRLMLRRAAHVGLLMVIVGCMWAYVLAYKPRVAENAWRGVAFTLLLIGALAVCVFTARAQPQSWLFAAAVPTLAVAYILAIAYDQRFALAIGAMQTALVAMGLNLPISAALVVLIGVAGVSAQLHDVATRSKLVRTGLVVGVGMFGAAWLDGLVRRPLHLDGQIPMILNDALWALGAGVAAGGIVQVLLPGIERLFKVTTAMTLLELNVASHPLLQKLAQAAPGTYQHSLRLADMSEAAADAIGADGLLCRVGAMFHDIGKMNKPQYFIENQGGGPNRHDKLSPAMSVLIIVGHVKDGSEMAREYGLPAPLRHFIDSHHGTTLVEYFYHAARQKSAEANESAPNEFEFRYPGPKPQTREAAIMMLCDGIESRARTLPDPTPLRIEQMVREMSRKRLLDGQFDDSNLTLAELHRIEQSVTKTLCAVYHGRIAYPKAEPPRTAKATGTEA